MTADGQNCCRRTYTAKQKQQHHGISVWQYKLQNLESFRNLSPFDTLMGHAAYVIFCQAVELRQCTLLVLIDFCPV